ncbi:hypothetical protein QT381_14620 [Galbitalea sp. SE-J8]|uniref:hypothetical protein n=1 Tax=Galbitalea sp. SE-J8 TaxID=3054952 RepID=UPI00259CB1C0|nr:hypothetical protein [Galbitalea sp. SE-J8]MDM4764240.1 hypothetical protein [Galbitalea sp. SE-J8]
MKLNWPLVGIGAGALVTAGIIVAIVTSPGTTLGGTGILTVDQLASASASPAPSASNAPSAVAPALHTATVHQQKNGCFDVALDDGTTAWAVWPSGTTQDADHVVLADGERLGDGDALGGPWRVTTKSDVPALVGGGGPASLAEFCVGEDGPVAILDAVTPH